MTHLEIKHFLLRACFGPSPTEINDTFEKMSRKEIFEYFLEKNKRITYLDALDPAAIEEGKSMLEGRNRKDLSAEEKKELRKIAVEQGKKLNLAWLAKLEKDEAQLNEKMTFFWHGHFACKDDNPVFAQALNNTIRKNALGKFKDLLIGVAKEPAMLRYLNNQQNRKNAPNENFAREVMELFTIGRGNYTEDDIKNAARAFTGWGISKTEKQFEFHENQHDFGVKTFMGKTGSLDGEDVIDTLLERKETAQFLTRKVYRFFVNDVVDESTVQSLAKSFYESGYDIASLMKNIFTASWFYKPENIGTRIKSPIELLVGINRFFSVKYQNPEVLFLPQKLLNQTLFSPPNVAGWAGGKNWIDSASLIFRMNLGSKILESAAIEQTAKNDDDVNPNMMYNSTKKKFDSNSFHSIVDWKKVSSYVDDTKDEDLFFQAQEYLHQMTNIVFDDTNLKETLKGKTKEEKMKVIYSYLLSAPEYQLS